MNCAALHIPLHGLTPTIHKKNTHDIRRFAQSNTKLIDNDDTDTDLISIRTRVADQTIH